ncbi:hypothetical protein B0H13DRAFT_1669617, partial [Mycena leptocephala]
LSSYLMAEIVELGRTAARDNKKHRILPRHLQLAICNDEELNKVDGRRSFFSFLLDPEEKGKKSMMRNILILSMDRFTGATRWLPDRVIFWSQDDL